MSSSIRSDAAGYAAIAVNGVDKLKVYGTGEITFGSDPVGAVGQPIKSGGAGAAPIYESILNTSAFVAASGAAIDFTGIPNWVKRLTLSFNGISTSGTSALILQLGAGAIETSGYLATVVGLFNTGAVIGTDQTAGVALTTSTVATDYLVGNVVLEKQADNTWTVTGNLRKAAGNLFTFSGNKTLTGALARLRVTTVGGSDTFDTGVFTLKWE